MRPMRFPRRSLWFVFIILGTIFGLPILPLLVSFVLVEPPLQRYYLLTYVESGETAKTPVPPPRSTGCTKRLPDDSERF